LVISNTFKLKKLIALRAMFNELVLVPDLNKDNKKSQIKGTDKKHRAPFELTNLQNCPQYRL
jgi:hypothetical protein